MAQLRTRDEIIADPEASAEEIASLDNWAQLAHPNCPIEWWLHLAARFTYTRIITSPLYELVTLAEPDRWHAIEREAASFWLRDALENLNMFPLYKQDEFVTKVLWYGIQKLELPLNEPGFCSWANMMEYRALVLDGGIIPPALNSEIETYKADARQLSGYELSAMMENLLLPHNRGRGTVINIVVNTLWTIKKIPRTTTYVELWKMALPYLELAQGVR